MSSCWNGAVDGETGLREGRGTYTYPNTFFVYAGNYEHGIKQGTGRLYLGSKDNYYEGAFVDGEIQGLGTRVYANGDTYRGNFVLGERHGEGVLTERDGTVYDGFWADNVRDGFGVLTRPDGERYEGEWAHHRQDGQGILHAADGRVYEGDFARGREHGRGECTWRDGSQYVGEWADGVPAGKGVMYDAVSGVHMDMVWHAGRPRDAPAAMHFASPVPPARPSAEELAAAGGKGGKKKKDGKDGKAAAVAVADEADGELPPLPLPAQAGEPLAGGVRIELRTAHGAVSVGEHDRVLRLELVRETSGEPETPRARRAGGSKKDAAAGKKDAGKKDAGKKAAGKADAAAAVAPVPAPAPKLVRCALVVGEATGVPKFKLTAQTRDGVATFPPVVPAEDAAAGEYVLRVTDDTEASTLVAPLARVELAVDLAPAAGAEPAGKAGRTPKKEKKGGK